VQMLCQRRSINRFGKRWNFALVGWKPKGTNKRKGIGASVKVLFSCVLVLCGILVVLQKSILKKKLSKGISYYFK
jgi:hypothetical protein